MATGSYVVRTLGCKANLYDSQLIEAELRKRGWAPAGEDGMADVCIVNSCTVTDEADRQSRKLASRLARENPRARVVVTGCSAEVDPERLARSPGIDYVIGNRDKPRMVDLILGKLATPRETQGEVLGAASGYEELLSRHPMDREWQLPQALEAPGADKTRAFIKIQEGCNSFCTYCIIPYGRGPSRSLRPREILEQVRALAAQGAREAVITGTNIGDYGTDWSEKPELEELLRMILAETRLERLRVSSLDPTEITPGMIELMERDARLCPHFHVSLQSPHARILKAMKRKYSSSHVRDCLERIGRMRARVGGVFVGMDVITGFPGETEGEFEESYEALRSLPWSRLHVFPYSEREGTPATRLPGAVPQAERLRRARRLNELSLERLRGTHERVLASGVPLRGILLEKATRAPAGEEPSRAEDWLAGYTPNYLRAYVRKRDLAPGLARNSLVDAIPTKVMLEPAAGDAAFIAKPLPPA